MTTRPRALADGELELPMWQLPPREEDCAAARTRSLWFGVIPTHSADVDERSLPRLDNRTLYRVRCLARQHPGPGARALPGPVLLERPDRAVPRWRRTRTRTGPRTTAYRSPCRTCGPSRPAPGGRRGRAASRSCSRPGRS